MFYLLEEKKRTEAEVKEKVLEFLDEEGLENAIEYS
jgi:hypothetical protein